MLNGRPRPETEKRDPAGAPHELVIGCGAWIRTKDLRVMSPTSCRCSTPRFGLYLALFGPAGQGLGLGDGAAGAGVAVTRYRRSLGLE